MLLAGIGELVDEQLEVKMLLECFYKIGKYK